MEETIGLLSGKEFEADVLHRLERYREEQVANIGRYGVQAVAKPDPMGGISWQTIRSLPDFEGVLGVPGLIGRQVIFDCKVTSQSSFPLREYQWLGARSATKARQLRHMLDRSQYRVPCYFLIHWNARELAKKSEPAETWLFPISYELDFWMRFTAGEEKSIKRKHCHEYGSEVHWDQAGRDRSVKPDVLGAIIRDATERGLLDG